MNYSVLAGGKRKGPEVEMYYSSGSMGPGPGAIPIMCRKWYTTPTMAARMMIIIRNLNRFRTVAPTPVLGIAGIRSISFM